jgi:oligopeptidase B
MNSFTAAAVCNMRPDLIKVGIAEVPFVDAIVSMCDTTVPWTQYEFTEWGNSNEDEVYKYMKEYCPMTNIKKQDYPHMLVTGGYQDPRVCYWEPAKFVAKLRALKTDKNLLLLKMNMEGGHFTSGGATAKFQEDSFTWAFIHSCFFPSPQ